MTSIKYFSAWAIAGFCLPLLNMMDGPSLGGLNFVTAALFVLAGAVMATGCSR